MLNRTERDVEWSRLMRSAIGGDEAAYRLLLTDLSRALRPIVRRGYANVQAGAGDIEDIVQEVMLAIHLKRHTWDQSKPIAPWIIAIARNKMIDHLRRRGRRSEVAIDGLIDTLEAGGAEDSIHAMDAARALGTLSERNRDIVRSIAIDGHTARDVADRIGMTEVAVRVALHRSLKALSQTFKERMP